MKNSIRAFLSLFTLCTLLNIPLAEAISLNSTNTFISLVENQWILPPDLSLERAEITPEQTRWIVGKNVNAKIQNKLKAAGGVRVQFKPVNSMTSIDVNLLELDYPDAKTAMQVRQILEKQKYFSQSKLLIPYTSVDDASQVFIAFTESAGDRFATEFIVDFPSLWARNKTH